MHVQAARAVRRGHADHEETKTQTQGFRFLGENSGGTEATGSAEGAQEEQARHHGTRGEAEENLPTVALRLPASLRDALHFHFALQRVSRSLAAASRLLSTDQLFEPRVTAEFACKEKSRRRDGGSKWGPLLDEVAPGPSFAHRFSRVPSSLLTPVGIAAYGIHVHRVALGFRFAAVGVFYHRWHYAKIRARISAVGESHGIGGTPVGKWSERFLFPVNGLLLGHLLSLAKFMEAKSARNTSPRALIRIRVYIFPSIVRNVLSMVKFHDTIDHV